MTRCFAFALDSQAHGQGSTHKESLPGHESTLDMVAVESISSQCSCRPDRFDLNKQSEEFPAGTDTYRRPLTEVTDADYPSRGSKDTTATKIQHAGSSSFSWPATSPRPSLSTP